MSGQKQDTEDRTGKYGGDDGALENERAEVQPGEDPGIVESPPPAKSAEKTQAEHKQDKDLESGEELPG